MENLDKKIYKVKILDIKDEFKNVKTYTLEKPEGLSWEEGSSFHLAIPGFNEGGERLIRNSSTTLASTPSQMMIQLILRPSFL